jgi:hypothetical protein
MSKSIAMRPTLDNSVSFPRELRDAIPDHDPSAGRVLKLESAHAQPAHTVEWGRLVQVKLEVCETGRLTGVFDVWIDMEAGAAEALAQTIPGAVEQSAKLKPAHGWPVRSTSKTQR